MCKTHEDTYTILVGKAEGTRLLERSRHNNVNRKEIGYDWILLASDSVQWWTP